VHPLVCQRCVAAARATPSCSVVVEQGLVPWCSHQRRELGMERAVVLGLVPPVPAVVEPGLELGLEPPLPFVPGALSAAGPSSACGTISPPATEAPHPRWLEAVALGKLRMVSGLSTCIFPPFSQPATASRAHAP